MASIIQLHLKVMAVTPTEGLYAINHDNFTEFLAAMGVPDGTLMNLEVNNVLTINIADKRLADVVPFKPKEH